MLKENFVGNGKVVLIAGGGKIYTDIAARFVHSERELEDIVASPYSRQIVRNILESNHRAALEFDYFIFGVDGYSRVCETQLVRKRIASYLIKSGRAELDGKRDYSVVIPESIRDANVSYIINNHISSVIVNKDGQTEITYPPPFTINLNPTIATLACLLTGNQTIAGTKTFSSSPIVPTPDSTDNSTKAATTAFVTTKVNAVNTAVTAHSMVPN